MTRETRTALLCGLALIIAFGLALNEIKGPPSSPPPQGMSVEDEFTRQSLSRAVGPILPREDHPSRSTGGTRVRGPRPMRSASASAAPARLYTVTPNDSLTKIARAVYGPRNGDAYRLIYEANRDVLPDEETLRVGQVLTIPALAGPASARPRPRSVPGASYAARDEQSR